jgi:serine-type D-Ala-D-Ala carboxypeptidase/endopeptidase (penicillin-binding protein 4)
VLTRVRLSRGAARVVAAVSSAVGSDHPEPGGALPEAALEAADPAPADRSTGAERAISASPSSPASPGSSVEPAPPAAVPATSAPAPATSAIEPSTRPGGPGSWLAIRAGARPTQAAPVVPADQWLRRGMAAVGLVLVVAVIGGSAAGTGNPADQPGSPAASAAAPPAASVPVRPEPSAPAPVLGDDLGSAPVPSAAGVARALADRLADPRLGGRVSAQVSDVATGAVLLNRGAGNLATPASTAKLLTATALLAVRTADDRLTTRVVAGSRPGEVVLVGAGDPTLSAARPGTPTPFAGAPRLSDLAAQLRKTSPAKITRVVVDVTRFSGPQLAPGWDPTDVDGGFVAPIAALMSDVGRVEPGDKSRRSPVPDLAAGKAFAARLGLPADAVTRGRAKAGATVLAQVTSAPLSVLIEQMLLESDNVLAEALARQVAIAEKLPASFAGAADAVRRVLGRIGVPTAGLHMMDGSGLSPLDKVSPAVLVAVLRAVASVDHPTLHALVPGLPVGGYDGTLDERYLAGPSAVAAGSVRAKTGTLNGVSSLAGIVADKDGRLLVFAFLADAVTGGTLPAEAALDESAAVLARCGCR